MAGFLVHKVLSLCVLLVAAGLVRCHTTQWTSGGTEWYLEDSQPESISQPEPVHASSETKGEITWNAEAEHLRSYNVEPNAFTPSGNPSDDCWRSDPNWAQNRQALANCAVGFGSNAFGGLHGSIYIVTTDTYFDVVNPAPGTLRYGVIQQEPLWIIFSGDMNIKLKNELIMSSFKTIDGRGYNIHIAGGAGFTLQYISNVIIHGIHIRDIVQTGPAIVRSNSSHVGHQGISEGDGVNIFGSHDILFASLYQVVTK